MNATTAFLSSSNIVQILLGAALLAYTSRLLLPKLRLLLRRAR